MTHFNYGILAWARNSLLFKMQKTPNKIRTDSRYHAHRNSLHNWHAQLKNILCKNFKLENFRS